MTTGQLKSELTEALRQVERPDSESTDLMQQVGVRSHNAEKMAWTVIHVMKKRPEERHTQAVLTGLLHDYVANTAQLVQRVRMLTLSQYDDQEETDA